MNLEKDYGSKGLKKGHFATNPEQYLYNPDGSPMVGDDCPYYNLVNPDMRAWWLDEAERMLEEEGAGPVLFIDALVKALDVGGDKKTPPCPEMTMEAKREKARKGDVWTRKFKHVEVILDLGNGTCEFRK
jgi:hypothetical protein